MENFQEQHSQQNQSGDYGGKGGFLFHQLLKEALPMGEGRKFFKKGEAIFEEGKHANGLFCILQGKIKISTIAENGKEQILRLSSSREIIGYRALISDESYRASAIALEDSFVGYVPKKTFFEILNSSPEISMEMMKLLSKDLENAESKLVDYATKTVRERLAEVLLLLKETYGFKTDSTVLNIKISREELSGLVGTATEVLIRTLSKFKEEGLVVSHGRAISIPDLNALVRIAKLHD